MKTDDFTYLNVKSRLEKATHAQRVAFALYCAELVIEYYDNPDRPAPLEAVAAVRTWLTDPTDANRQKCADLLHPVNWAETDGQQVPHNRIPASMAQAAIYAVTSGVADNAYYIVDADGVKGKKFKKRAAKFLRDMVL